jgi:cyanophycinase
VIKPLFLLADSQLLFWKEQDRLFTEKIREHLDSSRPTAAYIGASNGDNPEFYSIFQAAMDGIGLTDCRMVPSHPSPEDLRFLGSADLVLLSGGDVEQGWKIFTENGLKEIIVQRRYGGAVLVGVSAGAVQLGSGTLVQASTMQKLPLFQFAPFYVAAHDEAAEWWDLRALVTLADEEAKGIGIPAGAGAIYSLDGSLEPVRKPLVEFCKEKDGITENLLLPSVHSEPREAGEESL